uniref:Uncharacterized protein n=1 Tax=Meloidogyne incognita TaxID=6306 RepID=A0A914N7C1_MELIC
MVKREIEIRQRTKTTKKTSVRKAGDACAFLANFLVLKMDEAYQAFVEDHVCHQFEPPLLSSTWLKKFPPPNFSQIKKNHHTVLPTKSLSIFSISIDHIEPAMLHTSC